MFMISGASTASEIAGHQKINVVLTWRKSPSKCSVTSHLPRWTLFAVARDQRPSSSNNESGQVKRSDPVTTKHDEERDVGERCPQSGDYAEQELWSAAACKSVRPLTKMRGLWV